jgi:NAD(P)-dependent dehydrogenase (short-subunit alcohol dehydrogenase family)
MDLGIAGKRALITGSTAGIGYAAAEALAREGAHVIINGRTASRVETARAQLAKTVAGATSFGFAADLTTAQGCANLIAAYADVDILVNNLGIFEPKSFEQITDADWMRFFEANVLSGIRMARHYVQGMRKRNWGRIVFISSESGVQIPVEMIHYGVTKTAQLAVARGLAEALAGTAITVNSILPGPTKSRGVGDFIDTMAKASGKSFQELEQEFFQKVRPTSLIKRFATTQEVASLVAYIASPLSSATTGAALRVDGGVVKSAF